MPGRLLATCTVVGVPLGFSDTPTQRGASKRPGRGKGTLVHDLPRILPIAIDRQRHSYHVDRYIPCRPLHKSSAQQPRKGQNCSVASPAQTPWEESHVSWAFKQDIERQFPLWMALLCSPVE